MRRLFFILLACAVIPCLAAPVMTADYNVVPLPNSVTMTGDEPFELTPSTTVAYPEGNKDMERNAQFLAKYVNDATGMTLSVVPGKAKKGIRLVLDKKVSGEEAYTIMVDKKGVTIAGSTPKGVFYGVQTLRKSLPVGTATVVRLPSVKISDSPRFVHRGMMLDCSRHFFPLEFVKRYIDLIAMHNMNVFHWHLSDDQGWRIEIKKYPELTIKGSRRSGTVIGYNTALDDSIPYGGYYTQEQAREIVEYARQRYVTVIPEIDMPGHMLAALATYPELGCTGGPYEVGHRWGIYKDVLCVGNDKIYDFCEGVLDEIMQIFPSKLIHIGGDETPTEVWEKCPKCIKRAEDNNMTVKQVQSYFTSRIEKYVNSRGRRIIGWDEILGGDISQSAVIQSWRDTKHGRIAAEAGHDVIMSPTSHCYFDYSQADEKNSKYEPTLCGGYIPVEKVYAFEPCDENLSESSRPHILGVQANIWAEYLLYPNQVEYQALPRMAALAEVQWTSGKKDYQAFLKRLNRLVSFYDLYKLTYAKHLWPDRITSPWEYN
ncbi:beta-N-acetylhexosaminidase [Leyella lascolaii]|uniref:beta-N-acetylhexosaminidase n=1 Tax=Leyella lascolaii TaxID=1776379 RepID=UPI0023542AE2|nr:beta-N-acetylhexosaminidase [Leyella lascolaii]